MAFIPCTQKPKDGDPYYNTKDVGGYSDARKGQPTDKGLNVLSNCVGWAYGRFNAIGNYGFMKYLRPVNAENFMDYAQGCKTGMTPKLGAVMVWQKGATKSGSDGAGHVCIVEKINSATEVVTSESGWNNPVAWYSKTRKKGTDGRWGQPKEYKFLGFIYNPAVPDAPDYTVQAKKFQTWLNKTYGFNLTIDGRIGPASMNAAVQGVQIELNKMGECLLVDGGYGEKTRAAMGRHTQKKGDKGNLEYIIQGLIYNAHIDCLGFDGSYGAGLETAVKQYQTQTKGLAVDGRVGSQTMGKLVGR